jgi:hypothetical protein
MNIVFTLASTVVGVTSVLAALGGGSTSPSDDIGTAKERHESSIMSVPGVVGVGIGECEGEPCIKVFVEDRTPELQRRIPERLEGFKVDIEATGPFQALIDTAPKEH